MATLIVVGGPDEGQKFDLADAVKVMIGRDETASFQIRDPRISRYHVQLEWEADASRHVARDFRSANGVFVNGLKISEDTPLNDRDKIQIGDTSIVYTLDDVPDSQSFAEQPRRQDIDKTQLK